MNKYPRGKLSEDDEGEISFKIALKDKTVIIDFGKPVSWLGMPREQAVSLALVLLRKVGATKISVDLPDDMSQEILGGYLDARS